MTPEHAAAPGGEPGAGANIVHDDNIILPDILGDATPFQLLPELSAEEYTALRESIAADGILVPIQVDEDGVILDGHHRHAIAAELGIDCPRIVVSKLDTDTEKRTVALALNLSRRHLNREQTRQVIAASIAADPHLSDREHARRCGCSPTTVGTVRRRMTALSKLDTDAKEKMLHDAMRRLGIDEVSPVLQVIPLMTGDEFDDLADDIARVGVLLPVTVNVQSDGTRVLVDGRCRLIAAEHQAVTDIAVREISIWDEVSYVISVNLMRTDLTPDQRAMLAVRLADVDSAVRGCQDGTATLEVCEAGIGAAEGVVQTLRHLAGGGR